MAKVAGVPAPKQDPYRSEVPKSLNFHTGESQYHTVTVSDHDVDLRLDSLTFEQAEYIIRYIKGEQE
jgi:hypothetical protein